MRYIDPSGHKPVCGVYGEECSEDELDAITGGGNGGGGGNNDDEDADDNNLNGLSDPNIDCTSIQWGEWGCYYSALSGEPSHYYEISNVVCPASWHCTQEEMIYYLSLFAYPGQNPLDGPALPDTDYSVSPPFGWFPEGSDLYNLGLIQVVASNGGLTSTNITKQSHIFCCGTVDRTLRQDMSGTWIVITVGSGSNSSVLTGAVNDALGPGLFEVTDAQMRIFIMDQKFPP